MKETILKEKAFVSIVGKGEKAGHQYFLLYYPITDRNFHLKRNTLKRHTRKLIF